jgi:hypothetical protein
LGVTSSEKLTLMYNKDFSWNDVFWPKLEDHIFQQQKEIYHASVKGCKNRVCNLQTRFLNSTTVKCFVSELTIKHRCENLSQSHQVKLTVRGINMCPHVIVKLIINVNRKLIRNFVYRKQKDLTSLCFYYTYQKYVSYIVLEPEWERKWVKNNRHNYGDLFTTNKQVCEILRTPIYVITLYLQKKGSKKSFFHLFQKLETTPLIQSKLKLRFKLDILETKFFTHTRLSKILSMRSFIRKVKLYGLARFLNEKDTKLDRLYPKKDFFLLRKTQHVQFYDSFVFFFAKIKYRKRGTESLFNWLQEIKIKPNQEQRRVEHTLIKCKLHRSKTISHGLSFIGFSFRHLKLRSLGKKKWKKRVYSPHGNLVVSLLNINVRGYLDRVSYVILAMGSPITKVILAKQLNLVMWNWSTYCRYLPCNNRLYLINFAIFHILHPLYITKPNFGPVKSTKKDLHRLAQEYNKWRGWSYYMRWLIPNYGYSYNLLSHSGFFIQIPLQVRKSTSTFSRNWVYWIQYRIS